MIFCSEYSLYKGKRLPIRWMAPEALYDDESSSKSVVWSFAVACWEIFTLADLPHESLADEEYLHGNGPNWLIIQCITL